MTISNTKAKSVYETNGERREWEIGFDFDSNVSKLNIILEDSEGYQTIVEDNYLIEDGVVIYPSLESELDPIAEGYKIILIRETENNQEIDYRDNLVEKGLDKLTLQVQEIAEEVDRAIKVPVSEEGLSQYKNPILEIREETEKSLNEIQEATSIVSDYTQESALNAESSKEEADRAVEASNVSVMASSDAEASAIEAANLANEAKDAVSAYVNGLGAMRNAVLDLGVFEDNQRRASSCIIDFDFEPLDVFVRFSDSEKKMWIKGSYSFAGIEKVEDRKYKIFYSVSPEDFASQNAIKGPFYVQYVIKYSIFSGKPVVYRGRVDTVDQLPETAEDGDLWYVGPVEQDNKEEYVWQGGKWELLGSTDFTNIYTKEEIDNKVIVIEADIDANADAIQKTRSDFMESDSELQQQINAHANELTTQKNDIDDLGDQVAGIESKIPEGTSDTNPLINKQQLLDKEMDMRSDFNESVSELQTQITAQASAIANKVDVTGDTMTGALNLPELNVATSEGTLNLSITAGVATIATNNGLDIVSQTKFDTAPTTDDSTTWADALDTSLVRKAQVASAIASMSGGGSAEVPDNVYTQENLLGGKDIEIVPEPVEGGIDEHTLACWHFDTDNTDVVNGISLGSSVETSFSKFAPGCSQGNGYQTSINLPFGFSSTQDFSFDLWYFRYASNGDGEIGFKDGRGYYNTMWFAISYMGQVQCVHNSTRSDVVATIPQGEWAHLYAHHKAETNTYEYFVNGIKVYSIVDGTSFGDRNQFSIASYYVAYKDEVRISNCIRWTEDFEPPTQPYRLAVPTGNFMINFTGEVGGSNVDYVVEHYDDGQGNHCLVMKSKVLIQYGEWKDRGNDTTVTYLQPFATIPTLLFANVGYNNYRLSNTTATSFKIVDANHGADSKGCSWFAIGKGA